MSKISPDPKLSLSSKTSPEPGSSKSSPPKTEITTSRTIDLKIQDLEQPNIKSSTTNLPPNFETNSDESDIEHSSLLSSSSLSKSSSSNSSSASVPLESNTALEDTITLADMAKAEAYRNRNTLRKVINDLYVPYSIMSTTTAELGEYGAGLELYFIFVKQLGFLFLIISLLSVWPIYENSSGNGLHHGAAKQWWTYWSLANQRQIDLSTLDIAEQQLSTISKSRIVISIADFIGALCFVGFLVRYYYISKKTVTENFKNNVTAADYAVEIKGIPKNWSDTEQIRDHFEQFGEVVELYLAREYEGMLNEYRERANLSTRLGYERIIGSTIGFKNERKIKEIEKKICKFDTEIHIRFKKGNVMHDSLPVNRGYLIFNRLDDKKNCLEGCRNQKLCCRSMNIAVERLFQGEIVLKVKQTTEPSNILWENLEITRCERRMRKSLSLFLALAILVGSTTAIYLLKTYDSTLPTDNYCLKTLKINSSLTLKAARSQYTSNDEIYCYCKYQSWSDIMGSTEFSSYCNYFILKILTSLMLKFLSACGVIFINFILKFIFKKLSRFERVSNKTKEELNIMIKVFIATFINTALIVLLVNTNFKRADAVYYIPYTDKIFAGDYADFTREWYMNVGESFIFTIMVCVFSPHMITLCVLYPYHACKRRCCARMYKIQADLNRVFAGPQFDLACRNAQVLNLIFTSYLYSSAMPFLNILTAMALFCLYWTDKVLVLRHYKKPPLLSYHLNNAAVKFIPFIIILHCLFGIFMFGSEDVFPTHVYQDADGVVAVRENSLSDRLISVPGALHMFIVMITLIIALVLFCYNGLLEKCGKSSAKVEEETQNSQGSYKDELDTIKKHGLHTYKILENYDYKDLVLCLNSVANNVQTLRVSLSEKKKSMMNIP